jgi:hypothetical protein
MSEYEEQTWDWRKRAGIVAYLIPKNWYMGLVVDDRQCSIPQKVVSRPIWWSLGKAVRFRTGMVCYEGCGGGERVR